MTTTELTGAEDVAWDLSHLYESGDDPRIEQDVQETETPLLRRFVSGTTARSPG